MAIVVGVLFAIVAMPSGRHTETEADAGRRGGPATGGRRRLPTPLLLLALAIACYVASEVGVSNWLVRFLEPAPLTQATTALALFWAGLTLGRLTAARLADRYDHTRFTIVSATATGVVLIGAILIPSLPVSIALFALAGFATGPVFPMIIVIGGDRYPSARPQCRASSAVGRRRLDHLPAGHGLPLGDGGPDGRHAGDGGPGLRLRRSLVLVSRQPVAEPGPAIG